MLDNEIAKIWIISCTDWPSQATINIYSCKITSKLSCPGNQASNKGFFFTSYNIVLKLTKLIDVFCSLLGNSMEVLGMREYIKEICSEIGTKESSVPNIYMNQTLGSKEVSLFLAGGW